MADLVYKVEDRSILLPSYRRFIVEPILPFLPAKLSPNAITHAGHLLNLIGTATLLILHPERGWPLFFAAITVNLYVFCDNADGAHARRTKQCSPLGEFLDHGLDQLNTVYIAFLTAYALGAPPIGWVALTLLIPGAAVVTFWEQSNTGLLRLGLLNQLESMVVLTTALVVSGIFGTQVWTHPLAFGLTFGDAMVLWPCVTILFGMARNIVRVTAHGGAKTTAPILVYLLFSAAIFGAIVVGAMSTILAVALAAALNVHLGMRMLARRLKHEPPQVEPLVLSGAALVSVLIVLKIVGRPLTADTLSIVVVTACLLLGLQGALDARTSVTQLLRVDQAA